MKKSTLLMAAVLTISMNIEVQALTLRSEADEVPGSLAVRVGDLTQLAINYEAMGNGKSGSNQKVRRMLEELLQKLGQPKQIDTVQFYQIDAALNEMELEEENQFNLFSTREGDMCRAQCAKEFIKEVKEAARREFVKGEVIGGAVEVIFPEKPLEKINKCVATCRE